MEHRRISLPPLTPHRRFRLEQQVPLAVAAMLAKIPSSRASIIERDPSLARPGELEALRAAIEKAAAQRLEECSK